jgi:cytochrome d ubiquinol oxidase subunit II
LKIAERFGLYSVIASIVLIIESFIKTDLYNSKLALGAAIAALLLLIVTFIMVKKENTTIAMITNGFVIALGVGSLFLGMFPRVMVSSIKPEYSLTIYNAVSSPYTLSLMSKIALVLVPIVLAYQIWTYWIFRKRVKADELEY